MPNSSDPWFIIVNPHAGGGKAKRIWPKIETELRRMGLEYIHVWTEKPRHAEALVQEGLQKGYVRFVAVGGDGTVNEVVNGMVSQQEIETRSLQFAAIPIGTGNDWRRTHRIPSSYKKALKLLKEGPFRMQDIGKVSFVRDGKESVRYFNNVLGLCFDAFVVEQTADQAKHGFKGQFAYILGILRCLNLYQCPAIQVRGEEFEWEGPAILANIGLCRYSGGGMQLVPKAIPDDGLFDITIVEAMTPGQVYVQLPRLYNGNIYRYPGAHHFRSPWVEVSAQPSSMAEIDGELLCKTPIRIEILPSCLSVISIAS